MKEKTIDEISEIYDIKLDKIIQTIKKSKAKKVLLQFPEGMKPYSQKITDYIEDKTNSLCMIFLGTCFGACDLPIETEHIGVDLIIQFGHSDWKHKMKNIKVI